MRDATPRPLPAKALRWRCPRRLAERASRDGHLSFIEAMGQPDALEALRLGL